jgi:hypothetical protein
MVFSVAAAEVAVENVLRKRRDKADIVFGLWRGWGLGVKVKMTLLCGS